MKKVVDCYYVHKSNLQELLDNVKDEKDREYIPAALLHMDEFFPYEVLKYNRTKHTITMIESPDWDTAKEPEVGDGYSISLIDGTVKFCKGRTKNKQIYHSKELFVAPDYTGFDIEEAKQRTKEWNSIPNLDKSRIGNKLYWLEVLAENGLEA